MMKFVFYFLLLGFSSHLLAADVCLNPSEDYLNYEALSKDEEFKTEFKELKDFQADVTESLKTYCSCHYEPYLKGETDESKALVIPNLRACLNSVYCAKSIGLSAKEIRNRYSSKKVVCTKQQIKEWNDTYKESVEEETDKLKIDFQKKFCGLADETKIERKHKRCLSSFLKLIDDDAIKVIKESCKDEMSGKTTCVNNSKIKYALEFETNNSEKRSLILKMCTTLECMDKVISGLGKKDCTKQRNFPEIDGQKLCRQMVLASALDGKDATTLTSCFEIAKETIEKVKCIKENTVAKNDKVDDSKCSQLATIQERRKCRREAKIKKDEVVNVTVGGSTEAAIDITSLTTNDETFTGDETSADLTRGERRKLEKILKKKCSCERISTIEAQSECVKYAMNLDDIPADEYGKSVCSKDEVAAYKKSNSADEDLKTCILKMPKSTTECESNFTKASKDFKICTEKIASCAISDNALSVCTDNRTSCEAKARGKNKNGACFQMIGLHDKEEDKSFNEKLKKMCDAGADLGDANKINACYELSLKEVSDNELKFNQCLVESKLDEKYKLKAAKSICIYNGTVKPDKTNPISKDDYFYKHYETACSLDAPAIDQDKIISCYSEAKANVSKSKDKFVSCLGPDLAAKYDMKSFGQSLKDEFKVAGCEKNYDAIAKDPDSKEAQQELQQCIISRVGQEAAKAILAEFAKDGVYRLLKDECEKKWKGNEEKLKACLIKLKNTSNMIGAFSAMGMDVMSCIPPRSVREDGDRPITDSAKFCNYLDAGGGGSSKYATPLAKNYCLREVSGCDQVKDKPDLFQTCGMTVLECTKQYADANTNGQNNNYNPMTCAVGNIVKNLMTNDRPNPNPNFNTAMCIGGAISGGLNALTSAICANEKKYPTSADKEACLKKLKFINEIGTAGATAANCMKLGPVPMSEEEEAQLSEAERGKRDALKAQRRSCLVNGLGNQAVDLITEQICNAKKTQEEKEKCFKKAGIIKTVGTAAMRIADCQKINKLPYSDAVGSEAAAADYKACMQHAVLDSALGFLESDQAAELACKKHKDDPDAFEKCKKKYQTGMKIVSVGVHAAQAMAQCNKVQNTPEDPRAKENCLITAALNAGGELPGPVGQVMQLAAATNVIIHDIAKCKGDQACLAAVLAKQLPGDAGVYASFAVQGYGLIKQKNPCKVPSKYLYKAGALVKIAGDLTTHIVHKVQSQELKKKYADLVHDQKVEGGSDLYSNIKGFIESNSKDRAKEKDQEIKEKKFNSEDEANEAQLRGLAFARKNEENTLQSSLWQRPFLYSSSTLNAAANTMAVFEAMAEAADGKPYKTATWKECEKSGAEMSASQNFQNAIKGTMIKDYRHLNMASVNNSFDSLDNQQSLALYEDYERFIDGELKSISLDEYNHFSTLDLESSAIPLSKSLKIAANYTFNLIPEAQAIDYSVLENIGVNMVGGLFPGSGGFGQGSPVGYAQDIVYLFIHKGLDLACGPEKRNKETGHCEYTGKATIEFAAKKAAQALLKKNQAIINKKMNTAEGRIVIGLWNLGKLVKLVVDNEKIIKEQRGRIEYMKSQEAGFKAQTTGYNYKEKLRKFVDEYIFSDAHAKISESPDNLKVCMGKDMNVDFKCSCRQTGCYRLFPSQDKNFRTNLGDMSKKFGNTFGQGLNAANSVANMMDQMFAGMRGTDDISAEQMEQTAQKLQKFNGSLIGAYNKMRVNAKLAPLDFDKYVAAHEKGFYSDLHPEVQRNLANVKLANLSPQMNVGNRNADEIEASKKAMAAEAAKEKSEVGEAPVVAAIDEEKTEPEAEVQVAKADNDMNSAMTRTYSYDKNDINLDKELSLFKVISGRYIKKKDKLHKHD